MLFIDKNVGIYRFYNKINGKSYVGQSIDLNDRKNRHLYLLRHGKDKCALLQKAWNKYGEENFGYEIVCYCSADELNDLEKKYIKHFNSFGDGYNCDEGGNDRVGFHHSEETKKLIGDMSRGHKTSDKTKRLMSEAQKGREISEEARRKMSEAWTDERKKKHSEEFSGEKHPNYGKRGANAYCQTHVKCQTGEWFHTIREAAAWCGLKYGASISACIHGKYKHAGKHPVTGEPLTWKLAQ